MSTKRFDVQKMYFVDASEVGKAAFHLVNHMQCRYTPEQQALGYALAFMFVCNKYNVHPSTVLQTASNVIERGQEDWHIELKALDNYVDRNL